MLCIMQSETFDPNSFGIPHGPSWHCTFSAPAACCCQLSRSDVDIAPDMREQWRLRHSFVTRLCLPFRVFTMQAAGAITIA